ncbi:MAG: hypothetical protein FWG55_03740 [Candidatus Bathyarchaeota archaeon]|nr:hypothetical protein [Candidatus Termiticorpusculum sp.]
MFGLGKKFVLTLILAVAVSGLLLVESCMAPVTVPANPMPAPEVSVEIQNHPIWHPPTDHTNPYTGEVIYSIPGYYSINGSIVITIKNRSFIPYIDKDGNTVNIYYTVFLKALSHDEPWGNKALPSLALYQSDSAYTVITFTYDGRERGDLEHIYVLWESTVIDFRIQAVTGYFYRGEWSFYDGVFEGEGSVFTDFSITLPKSSDKPGTSKPTIKPTSVAPSTSDFYNPPQQNSWSSNLLIIVLVTVCILTIPIAIIAYRYGKRKTGSAQTNPSTTT